MQDKNSPICKKSNYILEYSRFLQRTINLFIAELIAKMDKNSSLFIKLLVLILCVLVASRFWSCSNQTKKDRQIKQETALELDSIHRFDSIVNAAKISDPEFARSVAGKALRLISYGGDQKFNPSIYLIAGIAFQLKNPDSAYRYYQLALQSAVSAENDTIRPRILYNVAMLFKNAYNYQDAIKMLDSAQRLAERMNDHITMSNCFNSIGNIEADLNNEEQAIIMFNNSLKIAQDHNLPLQTGVAMVSLARFEKNRFKATQMRLQALKIFRERHDATEQTGYLLANIGDDCSDPDSAIAYYEQSYEIGIKGDIVGLELGSLNNMAYRYADKNNYPKALKLLIEMAIPLATKEGAEDWLSTLYDSYADISHLAGNTETAYSYQKKALEAATNADRDHANNQVRLLNALLQAKSREIKILEQANRIEAQSKNVRWLSYFVIGLGTLAAFLILIFIVYRQRKNLRFQRMEIESAKLMANIDEQEKERLSMQLHDLIRPVKSVITDHIQKLQLADPAMKNELVAVLEKISGSLRQVSHRMNPVMRNKLTFSELCEGIRQDFSLSSQLTIQMEIVPSDLKLASDSSNHLYFILYELLANADKHVGKGNVEISVSAEFDNLYILYKDNGHGFDLEKAMTNGLGVTLIRKRVGLMGGHARMETDKKTGVRWIITLPTEGNIIKN